MARDVFNLLKENFSGLFKSTEVALRKANDSLRVLFIVELADHETSDIPTDILIVVLALLDDAASKATFDLELSYSAVVLIKVEWVSALARSLLFPIEEILRDTVGFEHNHRVDIV